jgi:lambda repressor-like predicted transcriptional regulator
MNFEDENIRLNDGQNVEETETPTEQTQETEQPVEAPAEKDWKAEFEKRDKSYTELQKLHGRSSQEVGELRKFKQEMEPYQAYLQQMAEQQKQQRYQQDPQAQIREYMDSQLQPLRELQTQAQVTETANTLQTELGENYETLAPIMANVLKYYQNESPEVAEYLAQNPIALVRQAAGDLYLHQMNQSKTQNVQAKANKQSAVKAMAGVARGGVSSKSTAGDMGSMNPEQMLAQLRKMGASIRPEE